MRRFRHETYWARPVPSFGDARARLLILGLAPAAHGGNRTGRSFTGDRSGEWLYGALHAHGFANQPTATHRDDNLRLLDCFIAQVLHCAPPANKPERQEIHNCQPYLLAELRLLTNVQVIVPLGGIAFDAYLRACKHLSMPLPVPRPRFGHGQLCRLPNGHAPAFVPPEPAKHFNWPPDPPHARPDFCDSTEDIGGRLGEASRAGVAPRSMSSLPLSLCQLYDIKGSKCFTVPGLPPASWRGGGSAMTFEEILDQAIAMLQRRGRVTYQTLRLQFQLDEEHLEALKDAILFAYPQVDAGAAWSSSDGHPSAALPSVRGATCHAGSPRWHDGRLTHPNRNLLRPNVANSPCCFVTWWIRPCWPASSTRKSGATWCGLSEACAKVIARFEGHIAQYLGDGLLALFRVPPGARR